MFEIRNVDAIKVNNIISIAGEKRGIGEEQVKAGSLFSDGENFYEIAGRAFVNYKDVESMDKYICVTLKANDIDPGKLQGKTLRLVKTSHKRINTIVPACDIQN